MFIPILLFVWFPFYMITSNFRMMQFSLTSFGIADEMRTFMVLMTLFVLYISYINALNCKPILNVSLSFLVMFAFCVLVFTTDRVFLLYLAYEASLLPILYIIVK